MATASTTIPHREDELRSVSEAIPATALFASTLQPSQSPLAGQVHSAVTETLRSLGALGCAALLASEFGDHPDCAAARMGWALATVRWVHGASARPGTGRVQPQLLGGGTVAARIASRPGTPS